MICPKCGCHDRVTRTITDRETGETRRYRRCPKCGHQFETVEKQVEAASEPKTPAAKKPGRKKRPIEPRPDATQEDLKGAVIAAMATASE